MRTIGVSISVPEPWGSRLQDFRVSNGDPLGATIPTHITLVPPLELPTGRLDEVERHLDTVAASHNLDAFTSLLKRDGTLCLVGVPEDPHPSPNIGVLIFGRRSLAGSLIGGIPETQEMLDFCAKHGIVADIEMIRAQEINEAYERMLRSDVKYRFVIDIASLAA